MDLVAGITDARFYRVKCGTWYHRNSYSKIAPVMHHAAFLNSFGIVRRCVGVAGRLAARLLSPIPVISENSESWPGLSRPSTSSLQRRRKQNVDARDKRGHDAERVFDPIEIRSRPADIRLRATAWKKARSGQLDASWMRMRAICSFTRSLIVAHSALRSGSSA